MNNITKYFVTLCTIICLSNALSACNTARGISEDVQAGTRALGETFDTGT